MNHFLPLLKDLNERFDLPQPTKSHILLEISADMEDLYSQLVDSGEEEFAAVKIVKEKFTFTEPEIAELVNIHQTFLRKIYGKLSEQTRTWWEGALLIISILAVAAFAAGIVLNSDFFVKSSVFIYPVLVLAAAGLLMFIRKFYDLYIKKDHSFRKLHTGVNPILIFGAFSFFIGIFGYYFELYNAGDGGLLYETLLYPIMQNFAGGSTTMDSVLWMIKTTKLMMLSLTISLFTIVMWFLLFNKISLIEQAEAEVLLESAG